MATKHTDIFYIYIFEGSSVFVLVFLHFILFTFMSRSRLSWLLVSFWMQVKYQLVILYHVMCTVPYYTLSDTLTYTLTWKSGIVVSTLASIDKDNVGPG